MNHAWLAAIVLCLIGAPLTATATMVTLTPADFEAASDFGDPRFFEQSAKGFRLAANCHMHVGLPTVLNFTTDSSGCSNPDFHNLDFPLDEYQQGTGIEPSPPLALYFDHFGDSFSVVEMVLPGNLKGTLTVLGSGGQSIAITRLSDGFVPFTRSLDWNDITWLLLLPGDNPGAISENGPQAITFSVPEPHALALFGLGLAMLLLARRRSRGPASAM